MFNKVSTSFVFGHIKGMASSRILTDTLNEVVEGSVWVHRQMLAKGESPYWYTRIKLPKYI
ncbi:MAG: hypothetical protein VCF08_23115, partial [Alphaproteobacteria bacterium]